MPHPWPGRRRPGHGPRRRRSRPAWGAGQSPGCLAGPVVSGIGDRDVAGQHPLVAGHHLGAEGDGERASSTTHVHPPADRFGVHRVVVGLVAHPVVGGQAQVVMPVHVGQQRRQRHHGRQVLVDALRRPAPQPRVDPHVGLGLQPVAQLGVEVVTPGEAPAGHEARLQIAVGPFHDPFAFGVALGQHDRAHAQRPLQTQVVMGVDQLPAPAHRDGRLAVIDTHAGHRPQLDQQTEMAAEHVGRLLGADHAGQDPARVARHPDEHRQHRRLAVSHRDRIVGEPQVPLAELAGLVLGAAERLGHLIGRPQLGHPLAQHRDPPGPADPLGDHRRRHVRRHRQQPTDGRLELVHRRPRPLALVVRRRIGTQRRPHRVASHTEPADDRLHAHPLSQVQPSDLCPLLHVDQVPLPVGRMLARPGSSPHR